MNKWKEKGNLLIITENLEKEDQETIRHVYKASIHQGEYWR